jgi:hypothetical protein
MSRWGRLAATLATITALTGCAAATTTGPGATSASPARPGATGPSGELPAIPVTVSWHDLGQFPGLSAVAVASTRYLVRQEDGESGVTVTRLADGAVVLRHRPASGQYASTFADLAGDRLVVADEDVEGDKDPGLSYIYDLATGRRTSLASIPSATPLSPFAAQAAVTDDGRYYYQATSGTGANHRTCVALLDLTKLAGRPVECSPDKASIVGYYVIAAEDGAAWMNWKDSQHAGCRSGRAVSASGTADIAKPANCLMLAATVVGGWQVWSGTDVAGSPPAIVPLRATDGDRVVQLGPTDGVTITSCAGYAYWRYSDPAAHTIQLRRWKPGTDTVEIVYSLDDPPDTPGLRQVVHSGCADGLLTVSVLTGQPDTGDHVRLLTLGP